MKTNKSVISVCIPSYNRPTELVRLLKSIDLQGPEIEVVICEDKSPARKKIRESVKDFQKNSSLNINYYENSKNLGYDSNIREVSQKASGEFIIYMGDDDQFVPGALAKVMTFLNEHPELGYVLKSHLFVHKNNKVEKFRYYDKTCFFDPGAETLVKLFRKSVFISGFIINRKAIQNHMLSDFNGTLLMQLYFLAEVALKYPCAYFDEPLTLQHDEGIPMFGSSSNEEALYTPGSITVENSLNFIKSFFKITEFIDQKYGIAITPEVQLDMAKYSYPFLTIQRNKGLSEFRRYKNALCKIGINSSIYFYIYYWALFFLGKNLCDRIILILKKIIGKSPKL